MFTLELPIPATALAEEAPPLRMAAASGMARAFFVVHFPPAVASGTASLERAVGEESDRLAMLEQAFVAELRELGGMTVVA